MSKDMLNTSTDDDDMLDLSIMDKEIRNLLMAHENSDDDEGEEKLAKDSPNLAKNKPDAKPSSKTESRAQTGEVFGLSTDEVYASRKEETPREGETSDDRGNANEPFRYDEKLVREVERDIGLSFATSSLRKSEDHPLSKTKNPSWDSQPVAEVLSPKSKVKRLKEVRVNADVSLLSSLSYGDAEELRKSRERCMKSGECNSGKFQSDEFTKSGDYSVGSGDLGKTQNFEKAVEQQVYARKTVNELYDEMIKDDLDDRVDHVLARNRELMQNVVAQSAVAAQRMAGQSLVLSDSSDFGDDREYLRKKLEEDDSVDTDQTSSDDDVIDTTRRIKPLQDDQRYRWYNNRVGSNSVNRVNTPSGLIETPDNVREEKSNASFGETPDSTYDDIPAKKSRRRFFERKKVADNFGSNWSKAQDESKCSNEQDSFNAEILRDFKGDTCCETSQPDPGVTQDDFDKDENNNITGKKPGTEEELKKSSNPLKESFQELRNLIRAVPSPSKSQTLPPASNPPMLGQPSELRNASVQENASRQAPPVQPAVVKKDTAPLDDDVKRTAAEIFGTDADDIDVSLSGGAFPQPRVIKRVKATRVPMFPSPTMSDSPVKANSMTTQMKTRPGSNSASTNAKGNPFIPRSPFTKSNSVNSAGNSVSSQDNPYLDSFDKQERLVLNRKTAPVHEMGEHKRQQQMGKSCGSPNGYNENEFSSYMQPSASKSPFDYRPATRAGQARGVSQRGLQGQEQNQSHRPNTTGNLLKLAGYPMGTASGARVTSSKTGCSSSQFSTATERRRMQRPQAELESQTGSSASFRSVGYRGRSGSKFPRSSSVNSCGVISNPYSCPAFGARRQVNPQHFSYNPNVRYLKGASDNSAFNNVSRCIPTSDWNSDNTDMSRYKETQENLLRRKMTRVSNNHEYAAMEVHEKLAVMEKTIKPFLPEPVQQKPSAVFRSTVSTGRMPTKDGEQSVLLDTMAKRGLINGDKPKYYREFQQYKKLNRAVDLSGTVDGMIPGMTSPHFTIPEGIGASSAGIECFQNAFIASTATSNGTARPGTKRSVDESLKLSNEYNNIKSFITSEMTDGLIEKYSTNNNKNTNTENINSKYGSATRKSARPTPSSNTKAGAEKPPWNRTTKTAAEKPALTPGNRSGLTPANKSSKRMLPKSLPTDSSATTVSGGTSKSIASGRTSVASAVPASNTPAVTRTSTAPHTPAKKASTPRRPPVPKVLATGVPKSTSVPKAPKTAYVATRPKSTSRAHVLSCSGAKVNMDVVNDSVRNEVVQGTRESVDDMENFVSYPPAAKVVVQSVRKSAQPIPETHADSMNQTPDKRPNLASSVIIADDEGNAVTVSLSPNITVTSPLREEGNPATPEQITSLKSEIDYFREQIRLYESRESPSFQQQRSTDFNRDEKTSSNGSSQGIIMPRCAPVPMGLDTRESYEFEPLVIRNTPQKTIIDTPHIVTVEIEGRDPNNRRVQTKDPEPRGFSLNESSVEGNESVLPPGVGLSDLIAMQLRGLRT